MNKLQKPELLAPGGNKEKCDIAFAYGADAVYCGVPVFGLRKYADNLNNDELSALCKGAKKQGKQVYITLNGYAHNEDLENLRPQLVDFDQMGISAAIISDIGVARLVKEHSNIPIHASTQASITNAYACQYWKDLGATRIILAREVSISDCVKIKKLCPIELEIFVHGAMCASYSGKCVISNYAAGRDSNRGGCIQSCRHNYELIDPISNTVTAKQHIMNAKDLMGIDQIPQIILAGIDSIKIEGRMKSNLYVANAVSIYRRAIDYCYDSLTQHSDINPLVLQQFKDELALVSNREFSSGGLDNRPFAESIHYDFGGYNKGVDYIGIIREIINNEQIIIDNKNSFSENDDLYYLSPSGKRIILKAQDIKDSMNHPISKTKPNTIVRLPYFKEASRFAILSRLNKTS
jgi:putative protease